MNNDRPRPFVMVANRRYPGPDQCSAEHDGVRCWLDRGHVGQGFPVHKRGHSEGVYAWED